MIEALRVFAFAFATVFVGMGILTGVLFAMRLAGQLRAARKPPEPVVELAPELMAVLAAAAYEALGKPVMIHKAHIHRERATELWSRAGRMDIMVSHRVEPKR